MQLSKDHCLKQSTNGTHLKLIKFGVQACLIHQHPDSLAFCLAPQLTEQQDEI